MNSMMINTHVKTPGKTSNSGGYAYFPGTGPSLMTCSDCALMFRSGQHAHCRKWSILRKAKKSGPPIDRCSDACKFFESK